MARALLLLALLASAVAVGHAGDPCTMYLSTAGVCTGTEDTTTQDAEGNDVVTTTDTPAGCTPEGACVDLGPYTPASNVAQHALIVEDVKTIKEKLKTADYTGAKYIYESGENSAKSTGMRTLQGFATKDQSGEPWFVGYMEMYGGDLENAYTFEDAYTLAALNGDGIFTGKSADIRNYAINKNLMCITMMYGYHELDSALGKATAGNTADGDAPHAWDEGFAFTYGTAVGEGSTSVWEVQGKRDSDFTTTFQTSTSAAFQDGLPTVQTAGLDLDSAQDHIDLITRGWGATFIQATLKYSYLVQEMIEADDLSNTEFDGTWSEGYTYWRCAAGAVFAASPSVAVSVEAYLHTDQEKSELNTKLYCRIKTSLESAYGALGFTTSDIGVFKDITGDPCAGVEADYIEGHEGDHEDQEEDYEDYDYEADYSADGDATGGADDGDTTGGADDGDTGGDAICFPAKATVTAKGLGEISMDKVEVGMELLAVSDAGVVEYSQVVDMPSFLHSFSKAMPTGNFQYVTIELANGQKIQASPDHFLPMGEVYETHTLTKAEDIEVNDPLFVTVDGALEVARVAKVSRSTERGAYNYHTVHGTVIVNSVAASVFTARSWPMGLGHIVQPMQMIAKMFG
jgi:hypothetical protein